MGITPKTANDESAWGNNKELNPQVNSAVTDDALEPEDRQGDTSWRAEDTDFEKPVSGEFDDAEAGRRRESIETPTPGID